MSLAESLYFAPWELACHDGTPYPEEWGDQHDRLIIRTADPIRRMHGGPLVVVSCYRTKRYNDALIAEGHHDVAASSHHMDGNALDIRPLYVRGRDAVLELHDMVLRAYMVGQLPELGGLGLYADWIHIDTVKAGDGHLRRWNKRKHG